MKIIKHLEDQISSEIHDAKGYIKCALKHKDEDEELADLYYALANEEMDHMNRLHKQVVRIIENYRKEKGEPPAEMLAVYNYLHEKHIDKAAEVKSMLSMYKE